MALKQKKRNEVDKNYQWDLCKIYSDQTKWQEEYNTLEKEISNIKKYEDTLMDKASNLYDYLELDSYLSRKLDKLYSYAHLSNDEDTANTKNQELVGKIINLYNEYSKLTTFFKPLLLKYDYQKIEDFYLEEPRLLEYKFVLEQLFRYKNHILSDNEEKLVAEFSKTLRTPSEVFEKLTDADLKFGTIIDEEGNEVEFTDSNYSRFIRSNDRRVRKDAFDILYNTYASFKNTLAESYSSQLEVEKTLATIYKFKSALEESLYEDNIDVSVYDNLIKTVNDNLTELYKYYEFRKSVLKLDEQHLYDTYVNLIDDYNKDYTFEEAKELVLKSLEVLGKDYTDILNKAFTEKWIDVYNNAGKRGGAYSSGCYDTAPYILLNFEGKLDDVSTLAHELGHSVHSYYSRENNPYQYSGYTLFVAEVASTVNELLLNRYMLNNTSDKNEKLAILNKQLELFKSTIFRQTMFAEFEKNMHNKIENKEILTYEVISNDYYEIVKKYFGDSVYIDELIKYEWARIPHFYYNFYVYKYATGLSAAAYIVTNILSGNHDYIERYKNFLKLGGTKFPLDELKEIDIDMTNPNVVLSAIDMFKNTLEEFKKLIDS